MTRLRDWLVAGLALLVARGRRRRVEPDRAGASRGAETLVLLLLGLASACAAAFVVVYAVESIPDQTQFLGLSLGLALLLIAAALIVAARRVVLTEELEDDYPPAEHPEEQEEVVRIVEMVGEGVTRRRLLRLAWLGAGGTLALAVLTPALSLGQFLETKVYLGTPWRRGRRLVDENGRPYRAADIERDNVYTAFAEHASKEEIGSPVVLVRLPPDALQLPHSLRGYDANGIVAYSKICTHAGCAVSMYRAPLFQPDEPKPALVCPCHYSTFDPAAGGAVIFGPAGRPLPMLPIAIDAHGYLRAKGNFDGPVGPSWWGVRMSRPNP